MSVNRRDFLKTSGLVVMAGASGFLGLDQFVYGKDDGNPVSASADKQKPTLVTIFLRGGADSLHVFVPFGDPLYYEFRKSLALHANVPGNQRSRGGEKGVLPIGKSEYWGINRHMKDLMPLMEAGTCVPIINVGSPDPTRSHFSAQDYMERASFGSNAVTTGWLNRYLEATKKPFDAPLRGLSAKTLVPRALRGNYPVLAGDNHTEKMDLFEDLYSSKNLVGMDARDGANQQKGSSLDDAKPNLEKHGLTSDMTRDIIAASGANAVERIKALERVEATSSHAQYPPGELGEQLRTIARVIKADVGLEVAQADYNGWDHHSGQGATNGRMSQMLGHLTTCINAFTKDLGPRMDRVMLLVMTEFGRTVHENGSEGTDHGRGSFMLAVGNMLHGREMYGTWNGLHDLDSERFQPVHTDFRAVFAESLNKLFKVDPIKARIFPGFNPSRAMMLEFMKPVA
jgi:uncharacterized protein (DUF1501 family)